MAIDWVLTLQEQADFAKQIADDVSKTLDIPDLSPAQALRFYRVVEKGAQTFDRLIASSKKWNSMTLTTILPTLRKP